MNRNCSRQSRISQRPSHLPNNFPEARTRRSAWSATSYTLPELYQNFARNSEGLRNRNRDTLRSRVGYQVAPPMRSIPRRRHYETV
jgi:hypothetical protein